MSATVASPKNLIEIVDKIESDIAWRNSFGERQLEVTDLWSTHREDELEDIYTMLRDRGYRLVTLMGPTDVPILLVYW